MTRNRWIPFFAVLAALPVASCAEAPFFVDLETENRVHIASAEWRVSELDPLLRPEEGPVYWYDEERLLLVGREGPIGFPGVYLWNVATGEIALVEDRVAAGCWSEGTLYFERLVGGDPQTGAGARQVAMSGPMGDGRPYDYPEGDAGGLVFSYLRCADVTPPDGGGLGWYPLEEWDGFLRALPGGPGAAGLHRLGGESPPAPVGIEVPEQMADRLAVRWLDFQGAYLIMPRTGTPPLDGDCALPAWWLWPDGRTARDCLPASFGGAPVVAALPTQVGWFVVTRMAERPTGEAGPHKAWMVAGDWQAPVLAGEIGLDSRGTDPVSPDGCRVAFRYAPATHHSGVRGLVLDLCVSSKAADPSLAAQAALP